MSLTIKAIEAAKPTDKDYNLADGDSLYLQIKPSGTKSWIFRYRLDGKAIKKSFGVYPALSLADARKKRVKARSDLANNLNPFPKRVAATTVRKRTFKGCAQLYTDNILVNKSDAHHNRTVKAWERDVFVQDTKDGKKDPSPQLRIGDKYINDITSDDIKAILVSMKDRSATESARKVFSSIQLVYKYIYAVQSDKEPFEKITFNPCEIIELKFVLGEHEIKNYPIIDKPRPLGILLQDIEEYSGDTSVKLALKMIANTFVRPTNIRSANWDEIDLEAKKWSIPGSKMKTKKELIVPLSTQVLCILNEAKEYSGAVGLIFPSPKSKTQPLSDAAMVSALRRIGYTSSEIVAHSFRGIFSTIAHESGKYKHDAIETQLAHSVGSSVSQAYNRAVHLEERIKMMQWYSDLLEGYQKEVKNV